MNNMGFLSVAMASLLISFPVLAQSAREGAALKEAANIRFLIAAHQSCAAFKSLQPATSMPAEERKDASGRVVTARSSSGTDFVFEYGGGSIPIAVTTLGSRFEIAAQSDAAVSNALEELRAREILYKKIKEICGVEKTRVPKIEGMDDCPILQRGPGDAVGTDGNDGVCPGGGGIPSAWFEAPFWTGAWMPAYLSAPRPPDPQCVTQCELVCDMTSDAINIACGVAGYYVGAANPPAGIAVTTACLAGSFVGKYYCHFSHCQTTCQ